MKKIAAAFLSIFMVITCSLPAAASDDYPSDWAADSVQKAISLNFVPEELQRNYQSDITRAQFATMAMCFLAAQYGFPGTSDVVITDFLNCYCDNHLDPNGNLYDFPSYMGAGYDPNSTYRDWTNIFPYYQPFSDISFDGGTVDYNTAAMITIAQMLGVVHGKGNGLFDPNGLITRQEAAVMLSNVYAAYDGVTGKVQGKTEAFADSSDIASWAQDQVTQMNDMEIMTGVENNQFDPSGYYTVEQCITTFLRLYQNAPTSRISGTISPLRTYDETLAYIETHYLSCTIDYQQEFGDCEVVCGIGSGMMSFENFICILYREGGYVEIPAPDVAFTEFNLDEASGKLYIEGMTGIEAHYYVLELATGQLTEYTKGT